MQAELIETGELRRNIEALLFVASEALSIKTLAQADRREEADVTIALRGSKANTPSAASSCARSPGGYRFATAPTAREAVEAYLLPPKTNLSPAALETLAIVAPTLRAGDQSRYRGDPRRQRRLGDLDAARPPVHRRSRAARRSPGRPMLYRTTPDFLEAFG